MTDRDCARIFAMLSEYLDRELPEGSCGEMEEHLRDCPECIQFVDSLKRSVDLCHRYGVEQLHEPVSSEALARLRSAYDKMLARRRARFSG
jgi:RNA polymerase sigma-70 factor (ECF subfamily)